jgi:hypothetical protein
MVWSPKTKGLQVLKGSDGCVFHSLEYDFFFITKTRADFTPRIQINK